MNGIPFSHFLLCVYMKCGQCGQHLITLNLLTNGLKLCKNISTRKIFLEDLAY